MNRLRWPSSIVVGAAIGFLGTVAIWLYEHAAIARGEDSLYVGFNVSHLIFLACLPWSFGVLVVMWIVGSTFNLDGASLLRPFFFAMPVVAGASWGWLLNALRSLLQKRHDAVRHHVQAPGGADER